MSPDCHSININIRNNTVLRNKNIFYNYVSKYINLKLYNAKNCEVFNNHLPL